MSILKLAVGREYAISGTIDAVTWKAPNDPKYKPQFQIDLANGDALYLDEEATKRQAERLGIADVQDLVGKTVTFWKKPMASDPNKGYLNIELGARANTQTASSGGTATVSAPSRAKETFADMKQRYVEHWAQSQDVLDELYVLNGETPLSDEAKCSVVHTLWIARERAGA